MVGVRLIVMVPLPELMAVAVDPTGIPGPLTVLPTVVTPVNVLTELMVLLPNTIVPVNGL
jgi:hypothetical protein